MKYTAYYRNLAKDLNESGDAEVKRRKVNHDFKTIQHEGARAVLRLVGMAKHHHKSMVRWRTAFLLSLFAYSAILTFMR